MLRYPIKYTNFNDEEVEEVLYFNLSEPELIEMEVSLDGGLGAMIKRIVEANDGAGIIKQFKDFILLSYGLRSDDGKRFIKNDEVRAEFAQTAAYAQLFMDLATDAGKAAKFIQGVVPKKFQGEINDAVNTAIASEASKSPTP